nr:MAG TPA: hypothetical protein [Caudoviricetes sp.]
MASFIQYQEASRFFKAFAASQVEINQSFVKS